jgi:hypothetical protein
VVSQALTLYITPVFYLYMEQFTRRFARRATATEPPPSADPVTAGSTT